jgi:D-arginine dehydrogenase
LRQFDIVVIGAGIAGTSFAFEAAASRSVAVVEMEKLAGVHATGRSVATFSETYGPRVIQALTRASRDFLENPPPGFCETPLLRRLGILTVARRDQLERLEKIYETLRQSDDSISWRTTAEVCRTVPILRPDYVSGAIAKPRVMDIDVAALHQGFQRMSRRRGAEILLDAGVSKVERDSGAWIITTKQGVFSAAMLVDAAGAWADEVAVMAGVQPVGLTPLRRTAVKFAIPPMPGSNEWPEVVDVDNEFYFKSENNALLCSPCDETPDRPHDVRPEEIDIAVCLDRVGKSISTAITHVENSWAGLRTFAPDRNPVVGFDPTAEGFFWLAGQGGYGIQTAPALARYACSLMLGQTLPEELTTRGLTADDMSPARFRKAA